MQRGLAGSSERALAPPLRLRPGSGMLDGMNELPQSEMEPRRRRGRPPGSGRQTPLALIEAAERLFGTYGIEAVSLRRINGEADVLNKSAITYHFGTRRSLVEAIWEYRLPELDDIRQRMIRDAVAAGLFDDPKTLVAILLRPMFDLVDAEGRHRYCAFFYHTMHSALGRELRQRMMTRSPSSAEAYDRLLALVPLPRAVFAERTRIGTLAFLEMVADRDKAMAQGQEVTTVDTFLSDAFEMATVMLLRPWPPRQ